jgi:hypothetical protein
VGYRVFFDKDRFGHESPNFAPNSRPRTEGSAWRRLPQVHHPPLPTTPTKFQLLLVSFLG